MFLGRVLGTVVATMKSEGLEGVKLLIVQPLNHNLDPVQEPIVAADSVQAGPGELVFLEDGREASLCLPVPFVPVDASVIGHVDRVNLPGGVSPAPREGGQRC